MKGRLSLPEGEESVSKLVVYVHGTGAQTYDSRYDRGDGTVASAFDVFIEEFSKRSVSFFTYNQRGARQSDEPPYREINEEELQTYLPLNAVEDIHYMITAMKENERLKDSKVYLLGGSEGTLISTLFAEKYPDMVDGLFLFGYMNDNLSDTMIWQFSGGGMLPLCREHFDTDEQGRVSREEYEAKAQNTINSLGITFEELAAAAKFTFDEIDANQDGYMDEEEMLPFGAALFGGGIDTDELFTAAIRGDDEWLKNNVGADTTSGWWTQHFSLPPDMEILPGLDLPINIYQGAEDMNADVSGVYAVDETFKELGKDNLKVNVFPGHDHSLNLNQYLYNGVIPDGLMAIFRDVAEM